MSESPGPGIDAEGRSVVDPTANVIALVHSEGRRQDDLRRAESDHLREVMALDRAHIAELRKAEAARIDANREVDNTAVTRAAEVAQAAATTLASVVATSAETLREQVAATAAAQTAALEAALAPLRADIDALKRYQYEAAGGKASSREGEGDRRSQVGMIVAILGLAATVLIAAVAFAV